MISSYFNTVHQSFSSGTRSQRIPSLLLSGAKTKEPISFFLYKDLFVVLHKVWDRKVVTIRRESLFLPTCYNGKLQQWLLTHHSFIGFTQFPLRRLTVKKGKFHPVKSFFVFSIFVVNLFTVCLFSVVNWRKIMAISPCQPWTEIFQYWGKIVQPMLPTIFHFTFMRQEISQWVPILCKLDNRSNPKGKNA